MLWWWLPKANLKSATMAALFWSSCEMQVVPKEIRSQAQTAAAANAPVDLCLS